MRKRYVQLLLTTIAIILLGCSGEKEVCGIKVSPKSKNVRALVTVQYSDEQLQEMAEFNGTLMELDERYEVECLREYTDGYQVIYCGENKFLTFNFNENGEKKSIGCIRVAMHSRAEYNLVSVGSTTLSDVIALDPEGNYPFLVVSKESERTSVHFTDDGFCIMITYDDKNVVADVTASLI